MIKQAALSVVRPKRPPCVLICAKCVKKLDEGRVIRKALKAELAESARLAGRRQGKLVQTKCMGLCPKRAVVLASGATLARGELLMVGHAADIRAALGVLLA